MDNKTTVLCYNKGCGQHFDPSKNDENDCVFHPGNPVFHDAYKGWSCCSKKTTDFTEFLNIKGCTKSHHNSVKPPEIEKPNTNIDIQENFESANVIPSKPKPMERPSEAEPLTRLKATVTNSLKSELSKLIIKSQSEISEIKVNTIVTPGTSCKNGGCTKTYESETDNSETCMHHPGFPVFHEGMKFWTCCMRRTTDFDNFLEQVGCTVGNHLWIKPKTVNDIKFSCRYDWYQTGPYVFITVYAKVPIPEKSFVEANRVKLHAYIVFGEEHDEFELDAQLFGIVDSNNSSVQFAGNKVEIKLKKAEALLWSNLTLPEEKPKATTDTLEENLDDVLKL